MAYKKYAHKKVTHQPKAKVALATKKYVKRVIDNRCEHKVFDLAQTIASGTVATNNSGSVVCMSAVAEGNAYNQREGEVIQAKSFEIKLDATSVAETNPAGFPFVTNLRVIIFQDHQIKSSTVPAVADVLEAVAYNSNISHISINARRFHILCDKWLSLDPNFFSGTATQTASTFTTQTCQTLHKKMKPSQKITFTNSTTGADLNNIYIMYLSDQATVNAPSVNVYSRLIFEDA